MGPSTCSLDGGVSYGCPAGSACTNDHYGNFCRELCTSATCRPGYACHENTAYNRDGPRTCMPVCTNDAQCSRDLGASYGCNLWSRRCQQRDSMVLQKYGGPCSSNANCETGICLPDRGGYCGGLCVKGGSCAMDGVCAGDGTSDQTGRCFDACSGAAECTRPGLQCKAPPYGGNTAQVCYCSRVDEPCSTAADCCDQGFGLPFPPVCLVGYCTYGN